jgi:hypothetical protein
MKQWKRFVLLLSVVVFGAGSFFAYRSIAKYRDLRETLLWMDQTYNPHEGADNFGQGHGWEIHYVQKGNVEQEVTQQFQTTFTHPGGCNMVIRSETLPVGVHSDIPGVATYTFNLCD